jgi:uncharacterized membrane protein
VSALACPEQIMRQGISCLEYSVMTGGSFFILTFLAALGSGLVAGIFFAFSNFVMDALGRLPPAHGLAAMQSINETVINPVFFAAFLGTAAVCAILAIMALLRWDEPGAVYVLAGSLLYFFGCFGVTMVFNVPLNDAIAVAKPETADGARLWADYLSAWTNWNHVRTVASLAASAAFIAAL